MTDEYKGLNENKVISLLNKFYSAFLGIYKNENFTNKKFILGVVIVFLKNGIIQPL